MTAYTNAQLNTIYTYIGFNFYTQFDPEIKSTIINTQSIADGGTQPDSTLQLQVLSVCANLAAIDQNLVNLSNLDYIVESSKGSKIDPARGDFLLRRQGRALIKQLCIILGIKGTRQDYYSRAPHRGYEDGGMSYFPEDWE